MAEAPIRLQDVVLHGRRLPRPALIGVTLDVKIGAITAILGGAEAGKSALLAVLAGRARPQAGSVTVAGRPLGEMGSATLLPQEPKLPRFGSLAQYVAGGAAGRRLSRRERDRRLEAALDAAAIVQPGLRIRDASPAERQRAGWARASMSEPRLLLLDDPLSAQDAAGRERAIAALRRLHLLVGGTTVLTTRAASEALALGDQMAALHAGRLEQAGLPLELYERPVSAAVARLTGEVNLLPGHVRSIDEEDGMARVALECGPVVEGWAAPGLRLRDKCVFALRPGRVAMVAARAADMGENALQAVVADALYAGEMMQMRLLIGDGSVLRAQRPAAAGLRAFDVGERVAVAWQPHHGWVFPAN